MNTKTTSPNKTAFNILIAISFAHLLNDLLQAVIPAMYPRLEQEFGLTLAQIGLITLCYQLAASIFQPLIGMYTDKFPQPFSQIIGMCFTVAGIVTLGYAHQYSMILVAVILVGIGSSVFHPESSRVAFVASGGRRSLAQSIFQIGGNTGTALAPLLVAWVVLPNDQLYLLWFAAPALLAMLILSYIGKWYKKKIEEAKTKSAKTILLPNLSQNRITSAIVILLLLIFSKYFYMASITSYFQFYIIDKFGLTEIQAQVYLFYFLIAVAVGTLLGGFLAIVSVESM